MKWTSVIWNLSESYAWENIAHTSWGVFTCVACNLVHVWWKSGNIWDSVQDRDMVVVTNSKALL